MAKTLEEAIRVKDMFGSEFKDNVEAFGYCLGRGVSTIGVRDKKASKEDKGKFCIIAYIQPMGESPHPIDNTLLAKIRDEVLPNHYQGLRVFVEYIGNITPR